MPENRIRRIAVKRIVSSSQIYIRAGAQVSASGGAVQEVISSGVFIPVGADVDLKEIEDSQLSELRKRLYAEGFSKRSIATAVKSVVRTVESRED